MSMKITEYIPLEALAETLKLPKAYLRISAEQSRIPCLDVNGRLRFNPVAVQAALDAIAKGGEHAGD